jgi:hypothetical protein
LSAAEELVGAALARSCRCPPADEQVVRRAPVSVSSPTADERGSRQRAVGFVEADRVVAVEAEHRDRAFATVGVGPRMRTAPPFTKICPATSRLTTIVLSCASPTTASSPRANTADGLDVD